MTHGGFDQYLMLIPFYLQVGFVIDERLRIKKSKHKVIKLIQLYSRLQRHFNFLLNFLPLKYQFVIALLALFQENI